MWRIRSYKRLSGSPQTTIDWYLNFKIKSELKGVFAKNKRGYRLTSNWIWWWSLQILLLTVASKNRKGLKATHRCIVHVLQSFNFCTWSALKDDFLSLGVSALGITGVPPSGQNIVVKSRLYIKRIKNIMKYQLYIWMHRIIFDIYRI